MCSLLRIVGLPGLAGCLPGDEPPADAGQLSNLVLAAFQGGMLLAQVPRDLAPLRDSLQAATDHLETFPTSP